VIQRDALIWRQELAAAVFASFGNQPPKADSEAPTLRPRGKPRLSPGSKALPVGILAQSLGRGSFLKSSRRGSHQMPDRESLRAKLVALLEEEMGESYALPQDDQDLRETLGLDSVDLVGLVMRIEREFHLRLAPEELALVKRVGDLLDLMEAKLNSGVHHVSSGPAGAGAGGGDGAG
jgi:acyl carrier protein